MLPLRWTSDSDATEFDAYVAWLAERAEVIVVDGSPAPLFEDHSRRWAGLVRHIRPESGLRFASGKVNGVITGVREASRGRVVLADDDVRYDEGALSQMALLLEEADLVRPQNYFDPMPWHAVWDTGRSLINRAVGEDFPGTLGVRRELFLAMGAYDGDVLFENLELIRTVRAHGGVEVSPPDLFVTRLPPTTRHFLSQRVRQAYDDLGVPGRMAAELAIIPALLLTRGRTRLGVSSGIALGAVALAERGRRRGGFARVVPRGCLSSPLSGSSSAASAAGWPSAPARCSAGCPMRAASCRARHHPLRLYAGRRCRVGDERGREARGLMRAVAKRGKPRPAAPADRDRPAPDLDRGAGRIDEPECATDDVGAVGICRDVAVALGRHQATTPSSRSDWVATSSQWASMKRAMSSSSARFVRATEAVSSSPAIVAIRSSSW